MADAPPESIGPAASPHLLVREGRGPVAHSASMPTLEVDVWNSHRQQVGDGLGGDGLPASASTADIDVPAPRGPPARGEGGPEENSVSMQTVEIGLRISQRLPV